MRIPVFVLICALSACGTPDTTTAPEVEAGETEASPEEMAAEIAKAIAADPSKAEEILAEHDLTLEAYEAMLYDIAADPERTAAYEAARK